MSKVSLSWMILLKYIRTYMPANKMTSISTGHGLLINHSMISSVKTHRHSTGDKSAICISDLHLCDLSEGKRSHDLSQVLWPRY